MREAPRATGMLGGGPVRPEWRDGSDWVVTAQGKAGTSGRRPAAELADRVVKAESDLATYQEIHVADQRNIARLSEALYEARGSCWWDEPTYLCATHGGGMLQDDEECLDAHPRALPSPDRPWASRACWVIIGLDLCTAWWCATKRSWAGAALDLAAAGLIALAQLKIEPRDDGRADR